MKKGFDFLKTNLGEVNYDLSSIVEIPEMFRLFVSMYQVGKGCLNEDHYVDNDGYPTHLGLITINAPSETDPISLDEFIDNEEIVRQWPGAKLDDEWHNHKLLRIAYLGQAGFGGLYLGCGEKNSDEIWVYNADNFTKYVKLDNNIFEFVKRLEYTTDSSGLDLDRYDRLYRGWGDEHWSLSDKPLQPENNVNEN